MGPHHGQHGAALAAQVLDVGVDDGVVRAGHDDDVGGAGVHALVDDEFDGGGAANRQHFLGDVRGERPEPCSVSGGGDHRPQPVSGHVSERVVDSEADLDAVRGGDDGCDVALGAFDQLFGAGSMGNEPGGEPEPVTQGEAALLEDSAGLTRRDAAVGQARRADR
jgi:hypothetical protein